MIKTIKTGMEKSASKIEEQKIRGIVEQILLDIEEQGDCAVRDYSQRFDRWSPSSFQLPESEIEALVAQVPQQVIDDICFAQDQIRRFAEAQLSSMTSFEVENSPGVFLGQKQIPVASVGCYIPGGNYPLVSSAHMGIIPAKVAGVKRVVACTPPIQGQIPAATIAAMTMAGVDEIYIIGGVQAVAALALGTETIAPVDMIVGPGNAYVAEAKRQLFGRVGIDLIAGPSEVLVIADESADLEMVAIDLVGQAEHGTNSPAVLLTTSSSLASNIQDAIERLIQLLPTGPIVQASWRDYGQILLADSLEECVQIADELAYEHVEILSNDPQQYLERLSNYGSLFLGPETTVPYGDMAIGTNHTLPTQRAARFTGGLGVGKFLKTVTYQRCTPAASRIIGEYTARLCALEGLPGHKAQADLRVQMYGQE